VPVGGRGSCWTLGGCEVRRKDAIIGVRKTKDVIKKAACKIKNRKQKIRKIFQSFEIKSLYWKENNDARM
jgi:hypothetical protein